MTYDDALAYLDRVTNFERTHQPVAMRAVRLERTRQLCERLGNPQRQFRSILVGGTNGKGSICAMIYAILKAATGRVGLYTSPHLQDPRERIRVSPDARQQPLDANGASDWISPEAFGAIIGELARAVETKGALPDGPPTYFELMTAAAFLYFARSGVRVAVLEVGLGGRLDATNVADPVVSVLGPIGFDHMDVLGHDLLSIAREKAGIFRRGGMIVTASQQRSVSMLIRELASEQACELVEYGPAVSAEVDAHGIHGLRLVIRGLRGRYDELTLPLIGRHQAENAAIAVAAVEALGEQGVPHAAVRRGLARTRWLGRMQIIQEQPIVLLDGSHNPQAAMALVQTLNELWPDRRKHLLLGMSADKPLDEILGILAPVAHSITCTQSRHPRACDAQRLAQRLPVKHERICVIPDVADAYTFVLNTSGPCDVIVVTGSLFLVGQLQSALRCSNSVTRVPPEMSSEEMLCR